jgi:hypothetical protein
MKNEDCTGLDRSMVRRCLSYGSDGAPGSIFWREGHFRMYKVFEVAEHPLHPGGWNYTGRQLELPDDFPMHIVFGEPLMQKIRQSGCVALDKPVFEQIQQVVTESYGDGKVDPGQAGQAGQ